MAKKRTRLAKIKINQQRKDKAQKPQVFAPVKSQTLFQSSTTLKDPSKPNSAGLNQLIGYNVSPIFKDLLKSLGFTILFIAALVVIFLYT